MLRTAAALALAVAASASAADYRAAVEALQPKTRVVGSAESATARIGGRVTSSPHRVGRNFHVEPEHAVVPRVLGYEGHQYDPETSLTYARARYLDNRYGVLLSRDAVEGSINDAPSLHRYNWTRANPLRYLDFDGNEPFGPFQGPPSPSDLMRRMFDRNPEPPPPSPRQTYSEQLIAQSRADDAEIAELQKRDPMTMTYGEVLKAGTIYSGEATYGKDPFNATLTQNQLSPLMLQAVGAAGVQAYQGMVQVSQAGFAGGAIRAAPVLYAPKFAWRVAAEDPMAPGSVRVQAAAQDIDKSLLPLKQNAGGQVRTMDEALAVARKHGVDIPENPAELDLEFVTSTVVPKGADAAYGRTYKTSDLSKRITWEDLLDPQTETLRVRVRPEVMSSDEHIVATMAHEMREVHGLRGRFFDAAGEPQSMTLREYHDLIRPNNPGNLHCQAWDCATQLVKKMREGGGSGD